MRNGAWSDSTNGEHWTTVPRFISIGMRLWSECYNVVGERDRIFTCCETWNRQRRWLMENDLSSQLYVLFVDWNRADGPLRTVLFNDIGHVHEKSNPEDKINARCSWRWFQNSEFHFVYLCNWTQTIYFYSSCCIRCFSIDTESRKQIEGSHFTYKFASFASWLA